MTMRTRPATRRRLLRAAGGLAAAGIAGCVGRSQEPDGSSDSSDPLSEWGLSDETVVEMVTDNQGVYFDPKGLHVEPETTVYFLSTSGTHSTTAYHPDNDDQPLRIPEAAEPWDSGVIAESDGPFEVTFPEEGVYDYYCEPHESMGQVGRIVVGDPQDGPGTGPIDELPPAAREEIPDVESIVENGAVDGP